MEPLQEGVWVQRKHQRFFQKIIYKDLPKYCYHCGCVGHVAAACSLKDNVELHDDAINQDTGEGVQWVRANSEGKPVGEHSSPAVTDAATPKSRTERGLAACNDSGSKLQDKVRGLGAWSVTD